MIDSCEARDQVLRYLAAMNAASLETAGLRKGLSSREREILGLGDPGNDHVEVALCDDLTIEIDFGWIFFYESKEYLRTKDIQYRIAGNAPIIVSRYDGSLHATGTAHPVEFYIDKFRRHGDPHEKT